MLFLCCICFIHWLPRWTEIIYFLSKGRLPNSALLQTSSVKKHNSRLAYITIHVSQTIHRLTYIICTEWLIWYKVFFLLSIYYDPFSISLITLLKCYVKLLYLNFYCQTRDMLWNGFKSTIVFEIARFTQNRGFTRAESFKQQNMLRVSGCFHR